MMREVSFATKGKKIALDDEAVWLLSSKFFFAFLEPLQIGQQEETQ